MVVAQTILITPIIAGAVAPGRRRRLARIRGTIALARRDARDRGALTLLWDTRYSLVTVVLAGFGRAAAEVGAVMIVGGNIDGVTRVMTTTIALETSKGDLPLALGLGIVLIALVFAHQRRGADHQVGGAVRRYG